MQNKRFNKHVWLLLYFFFAIVQIIILCLFYTKISLDGRTRNGEIRFHWMVEIITLNGEMRFHWMVEIVTRNGEIRFHWMVEMNLIVTRNGEIIYISQLISSGCTKLFLFCILNSLVLLDKTFLNCMSRLPFPNFQ